MMTKPISTTYQPPFGLPNLKLTVLNQHLIALDWYDDKTNKLLDKIMPNHTADDVLIPQESLNKADANHAVLLNCIAQLDGYFAGSRTQFELPLDLSFGTPFQQSVWQALCHIPHGQTISYAALAQSIGKPTAFRACANANGKNPISIIIPCHRVIASDGGLGGYTGGTWIKKLLLEHEMHQF